MTITAPKPHAGSSRPALRPQPTGDAPLQASPAALPPKPRRPVWVDLAALGAGTVGVVALLLAGSGPAGYNDPGRLADSVQATYQSDLAAHGLAVKVDDVTCAHTTGRHFTCVINLADKSSVRNSVRVSDTGTAWFADSR